MWNWIWDWPRSAAASPTVPSSWTWATRRRRSCGRRWGRRCNSGARCRRWADWPSSGWPSCRCAGPSRWTWTLGNCERTRYSGEQRSTGASAILSSADRRNSDDDWAIPISSGWDPCGSRRSSSKQSVAKGSSRFSTFPANGSDLLETGQLERGGNLEINENTLLKGMLLVYRENQLYTQHSTKKRCPSNQCARFQTFDTEEEGIKIYIA